MKVIGINGSPNANGNTFLLINQVLKPVKQAGIETQIYQLGGKPVHGCTACLKCRQLADNKCHIKNDAINECIELMLSADAIIIGSPTYFSNVTTEVKALIDCGGYAIRGGGNLLKHKIGAAVVTARRAGEIHVFNSINHFFLLNQMFVPGSSYWNIGLGKNPGDVLTDTEGIQTMETLGENIVWLLNKINT